MEKKALFLVNGLGLGNSTRCDSVIRALCARGWRVRIATSDNGSWYFQNADHVEEVYGLEELQYSAKDGKLDVFGTIGSFFSLLMVTKRNWKTVARVASEFSPDIVVTDSVYMPWRPVDRTIPMIALNNADVVCQTFRTADPPRSVYAQFYAIEQMDYLYHRFFADLVISPSLEPGKPGLHDKIRRVPPIVRKAFEPRHAVTGGAKVVIMLSGSKFGSPVQLNREEYPFQLDIVGRAAPEGWQNTGKIRFHGKISDTYSLVSDADLLVVNGGFSAVSEAVCLGKPVVVIPVPGHAEQWANGMTVEKLGFGMVATEDTLESAMMQLWENRQACLDAYSRHDSYASGAEAAADVCESAVLPPA